jgi:hypothetical protein
MKSIICFCFCLLPLFSCKKDDNTIKGPGDGYWILSTKQYKITATERSNDGGYFVLSGKESVSSPDLLQVFFGTRPTMNGKFKVVPFRENIHLSGNEIGIRVHIKNIGTYSSTGIADNVTWFPSPDADVIITNSKIKVEIPQMTTIIITSTYLDTVFLRGVIIEQ